MIMFKIKKFNVLNNHRNYVIIVTDWIPGN